MSALDFGMKTSRLPDCVSSMVSISDEDSVLNFSRDQLEAIQLRRLKWSLQHAYENVPMYRHKFDRFGVHPNDLQELEDLCYFPFTTKDDLRESYPFGMFAVPQDKLIRIHASSGTTGRPTVAGYSAQDLVIWAKLVARCLRLAGAEPGDIIQNAYGYGLFTGGLGLHAGIEEAGCVAVPISGGQTEKQIQLLQDFQPRGICCTPSYLLVILDAMKANGIDPKSTNLCYAILGAEPWTDAMRDEIEQGFGIVAVDIYGLSELMGPGIASESAIYRNGATVWEDHFLPEIISMDDRHVPLTEGSRGELVFTSLTKQAMPLIRYRTKDISSLEVGDAFPAYRKMRKVDGRTDDMINLRGVNIFPSHIEEIALAIPDLTGHFILEISRPSRLDRLKVLIEKRPGCNDGDADLAANRLRHDIKARIGSSVAVEVLPFGALPRSDGKSVRVHDRRVGKVI